MVCEHKSKGLVSRLAVASCRTPKLRALGKSVESRTRTFSSRATLALGSRQMHSARVHSRHNTQSGHSIGTIFETIPSQIMSCTYTEFGDYWIKLSSFIKICVAYNTDTVHPIWSIFELTLPWTSIWTCTNFGNCRKKVQNDRF